MTSVELYEILNSIPGFRGKVAYRAFRDTPEQPGPSLPFIIFEETETNNFKADNQVYMVIPSFDVDLCIEFRDPEIETAIETKLNEHGIRWERYPEWLEDQRMYQITYEVEA